MAIGTGSAEYFIILVVLAGVLVWIGYNLYNKQKEEGGLRWGNYQTFYSIMIIFILTRVFTVLYLMYLRYKTVPDLEKAPKNTPEYRALERTTDILIILWELVYLLGLDMLFTLLSYGSHIWKRMSQKSSSVDYVILVVSNCVLYFTSFLLVIIQFAQSYTSIDWVNAAYIIFSFFALCVGVLLIFNVIKVGSIISDYVTSETMYQFKEQLWRVKIAGCATGILILFRAAVICIDTLAYKHLQNGSAVQVVWNIFFKYICWVVPEFLILISLSIGINETDSFASKLALISVSYEHGKDIGEIVSSNEDYKVKKFEELEKIEPVNNESEKKDEIKKEGDLKENDKIGLEDKVQIQTINIDNDEGEELVLDNEKTNLINEENK